MWFPSIDTEEVSKPFFFSFFLPNKGLVATQKKVVSKKFNVIKHFSVIECNLIYCNTMLIWQKEDIKVIQNYWCFHFNLISINILYSIDFCFPNYKCSPKWSHYVKQNYLQGLAEVPFSLPSLPHTHPLTFAHHCLTDCLFAEMNWSLHSPLSPWWPALEPHHT